MGSVRAAKATVTPGRQNMATYILYTIMQKFILNPGLIYNIKQGDVGGAGDKGWKTEMCFNKVRNELSLRILPEDYFCKKKLHKEMIWENQHLFKHNAHFHTVLLIGSNSFEVMWLHLQKQWAKLHVNCYSERRAKCTAGCTLGGRGNDFQQLTKRRRRGQIQSRSQGSYHTFWCAIITSTGLYYTSHFKNHLIW